jgi:signal transduction histidine kinase
MVAIHSRDITERKEAERAIMRARERAEFFTDLLSHDINNYIQGVLGFLDLLTRGELDDEQQAHVDRAREQADRVSKLISRVRTLSKAEHAEELVPVDLSIVVDEVVGDMEHRYQDRPFAVEKTAEGGEAIVIADDLVRDLVMNLIDNSIKYNDGDDRRVFVSTNRFSHGASHRVRLEIADNGPGIPDEDKTNVFYRFMRRVEDEEGTGLGLSLVMALTERYQGRAWLEDRVQGDPGQGLRVIIELPSL